MPDPKQPPYSIEAEQSVLGGVCLHNGLMDEVLAIITEADFYRGDHQVIFRAQTEMYAAKVPIDYVTLCEHLRSRDKLEYAGGLAYVGTITADTPSAYNTVSYAKIVRERSILRSLIAAGQDISDLGFRADGREPGDLLEIAERRVFAIRTSIKSSTEGTGYGAVMDRVRAQMERNRQYAGSVIGLSTGLIDLDNRTSGLQDTDLIVLAGRPSMGKSTLAQNIGDYVAAYLGKRTAYFTMEMSAEQVGYRALANYAGIPLQILRSGNLNYEQECAAVEAEKILRRCPMIVDETGGWSPAGLRARARKYAQQADLGLIVVDYIQLMQIPGSKENRTNDVSEISRSLKAMAKELRVPVLALSQLSRGVEARENKRPRMSDLRESGGIEQDADLIAMIYRDEVYNKASPDAGTAEVDIVKQRNGALGMVRLAFQGELLRFSNLAHGWQPQAREESTQQAPPPRARGFSGKVAPMRAYGQVD